MPPIKQSADVNRALQSVQLLLSPKAQTQKVDLTFKASAGPTWIVGDQIEIEQIVFNIVHNAIDAASGTAGARVSVSLAAVADPVVVDVSDTGPGVPADLRSRVFEPFVSGKPDGTGLGLALCQRLAERMGGEVVLLDGLPTTFRVILRRQPARKDEVSR